MGCYYASVNHSPSPQVHFMKKDVCVYEEIRILFVPGGITGSGGKWSCFCIFKQYLCDRDGRFKLCGEMASSDVIGVIPS